MSPDHFTDTGVEDVYKVAPDMVPAPGKVTASKIDQKVPASQAKTLQANPSATLQPAAGRAPFATQRQSGRRQAQDRPERPEKAIVRIGSILRDRFSRVTGLTLAIRSLP